MERKFVKNSYYNYSEGVQFFIPDNDEAYVKRLACTGFGMIRYGEGSVYLGEIFFDGENYNKLGFGRQEFMLSELGGLNSVRQVRKAFFIGSFDYRKTDWIYGNGVMYFVNNDNKPACFVKGFFEGTNKVGEYVGKFDYSTLAKGYTPELEEDFDDWTDAMANILSGYGKVKSLKNLFVGDSYFELWKDVKFSGKSFYSVYDSAYNFNAGVGGTKFNVWNSLFMGELKKIDEPERIFINLGFNDIHNNLTAEETFENYKTFLSLMRGMFPRSKYYLLNVVASPLSEKSWDEEERFNVMTAATAEELNVTVIDMRSKVRAAEAGGVCFDGDGIHLNPRGYAELERVVSAIIKD